jgi:hypothetical protein
MDIVYHNGTNGSSPWVEFYPYTPSASAGYAFMGLFGVATLAHFVFIFLFRAPYFLPMIIGGICTTNKQISLQTIIKVPKLTAINGGR